MSPHSTFGPAHRAGARRFLTNPGTRPFGTLASAATGTCEVGGWELALVTVADSAFLVGSIANLTSKTTGKAIFTGARATVVARGAVIADAGQNIVQAGLAAQQAVDDPTANNILVAGAITAAILLGVGWKKKTVNSDDIRDPDILNPLLHGTGGAPGITELSGRVKSTAVLRQQLSREGKSYEFIFIPDKGIFAINKRLGYGTGTLSPHQTIRESISSCDKSYTVAGIIRVRDGKIYTDEFSGHYGVNWTDEIRGKFTECMRSNGFEVIHDSW